MSASKHPKLLLLAIDGLSFHLLERWSAQGNLPAFKKLMEGGCYGLSEPFNPSNSAVIWTSVMTGMNPNKHGIDSFIYYKVRDKLIKKTAVKKILKFGVRPVFRWLEKRGYIQDIPFSLSMIKQKMLWEIFAQEGRNVGVINWWYSWPACEVPGFIISDRVHYCRLRERSRHGGEADHYLVYPDRLLDEVMKKVVDPSSLSFDVYKRFMKVDEGDVERMKDCHYTRHHLMSEFKYLYSMDESVRRLAFFCLKEFPQPDFLALYFRGIDIISHCALKYLPENRESLVTERDLERFGETVLKYYHYIDRVVDELIKAVSAGTTIILVSDHGFAREPDGRFGHRKTRPPGMYILCGPHIRSGIRVDYKSLYDIAPTILHLSHLPISREMDGHVFGECVEDAFLKDNPIGYIESYGAPVRCHEPSSPESEEEIKERLRALGYID